MKIDQKKLEIWLVNPFIQGGIIAAMILLFVGVEAFMKWTGLSEPDQNFPWITSTSLILFYIIANSVISLKAKSIAKYWGKSITTFILLLVLGSLFAYMVSGMTIDEAGTFRWIYFVLTLGYLIFLAIVQTMKRIVDIAIKQDKRLRGEE
jgi:hypothetical protein